MVMGSGHVGLRLRFRVIVRGGMVDGVVLCISVVGMFGLCGFTVGWEI